MQLLTHDIFAASIYPKRHKYLGCTVLAAVLLYIGIDFQNNTRRKTPRWYKESMAISASEGSGRNKTLME